jgi:hypothetical protein
MAAQPEASTVVRATVEASMVALAVLVEAAATEVAEATVAESTRSIQLDPAKSKRARWANATVGLVSSYLSSPPLHLRLRKRDCATERNENGERIPVVLPADNTSVAEGEEARLPSGHGEVKRRKRKR